MPTTRSALHRLSPLALGLALVAGSLLAAACSDDDQPTGPPEDRTGVYELENVNGVRLPILDRAVAGVPVWYSWGELQLNADFTYLQADVFTTPEAAETVAARGTWQRVDETTVRFTPESGTNFPALLTAHGLEAASPRGRAVYRWVRP